MQRAEWIDMIKALPSHIEAIKALSIGTDILRGPNSYDIGLVVDFASAEDMDAYSDHPEHQKVLDVSGPVKQHLAVVDFEF